MSVRVVRPALLGRGSYSWFRTLETRWSDNDMYRHVNNVTYYGWFDTVVNHWLIRAGLLDLEAGDTVGLVVETGCRYARPLTYPDPVEIGLGVEMVGRSSVAYRLGVFSPGDDDPAAEGRFVHVYVDRQHRRPLTLSSDWRDAFASVLLKVDSDG